MNSDSFFDSVDVFIETHPVATVIICLVIIVAAIIYIPFLYKYTELMHGKDGSRTKLTPTQKFILAASSPTIGNNYKCVIDIWDTHLLERKVYRVKQLFEWSWGEFTYENAKNMAEECLNHGYNIKYQEYCNGGTPSSELSSKYTDFQLELFKEMKEKYPRQGMLAWDLVRVLSIVGGAYMGGIMEYEEAGKIAFEACRRLQENFSSWDDMVGSYTLGYQFWRGERKKDRLKYYKKMKRRSWIYKISWNTVLREDEL